MSDPEVNHVKPICGIIMPISAIDGCDEGHWIDVQQILVSAINDAGYDANLVSNSDDVGVIQKRIVQNLYENPIIVCDISGKNPNVMLELGIRLAFDKAIVLIKDDRTSYPFDTSPIEHLNYPRDLRFNKINDFRKKLSDKIRATALQVSTDENYSPFIKHFGDFKVVNIKEKEVPAQEFILDELKMLRRQIGNLSRSPSRRSAESTRLDSKKASVCMKGVNLVEINKSVATIKRNEPDINIDIIEVDKDHFHITLEALVENANVGPARMFLQSKRRKMRDSNDEIDD